jgi:hypothetical protein
MKSIIVLPGVLCEICGDLIYPDLACLRCRIREIVEEATDTLERRMKEELPDLFGEE